MTVQGIIRRVFKANGSWSSILVEKADGETMVAAGTIVSPVVDCEIIMDGNIVIHPKYGKQFKVESSLVKPREDKKGIYQYLSSGLICGVGERMAKKIVDRFGSQTLKIIEETPEKLLEISGISEKKALTIRNSHFENMQYRALMDLFHGQISNKQLLAIYNVYKEKSVETVKANPYQLIYDVDGIGFVKADALAKKMGISNDDPRRASAAMYYSLFSASSQGHCYMSLESLVENTKKLIPELDDDIITYSIAQAAQEGKIYVDQEYGNAIYTKKFYLCEKGSADLIVQMLRSKPVFTHSINTIENAIQWVEAKTGFSLEDKQKEAVISALTHRLSIITGGPGTGKSTIIQAIVEAFSPDNVILAAPTGKAAQRMSEITGLEACTVCRLVMRLLDRPHFIVIDEASMLDLDMAYRLLKLAVESRSSLLFVGDVYQLPPIGAGSFFKDIVDVPCVPTVTLQVSYRQSGKPAINAQKINQGEGVHALLLDDTFQVIEAGKEIIQQEVIDAYLKMYQKYGVREVCCVTPIRQKKKNSQTSSEALNEIIRDKVSFGKPALKGCDFRIGDRVMQTVNDSEKGVVNGDCGIVLNVKDEMLAVAFDKGDVVYYTPFETSVLTLAYAMSVHKSQGSEYKAVIVAQNWSDYMFLNRCSLYTAVTRAKENVVIVGESRAINKAIRTVSTSHRNTRLKQRIVNQYFEH